MMQRHELFREIREELSKLYWQRGDQTRVVADAGLDLSEIEFNASAANVWRDILDVAERKGRVLEVLDIAIAEAPARSSLVALRASYVAWVGQEATLQRETDVAGKPATRISQLRKSVLERRLAQLAAEYEALSRQLERTIDAVDELKIKRHMEDLLLEAANTEAELRQL